MTGIFRNLLLIISPAILALVGYVAVRVEVTIKRKTGIQIEGYHRDALHSASNTDVSLALAWAERQETQPSIDELRGQVVAYAKRSVPDALAFLGAKFDQLLDMSAAKREEKMSAS